MNGFDPVVSDLNRHLADLDREIAIEREIDNRSEELLNREIGYVFERFEEFYPNYLQVIFDRCWTSGINRTDMFALTGYLKKVADRIAEEEFTTRNY